MKQAPLFAVVALMIPAPTSAAEYVPGMTCEQVGDFAEAVATQMKDDPRTGFVGLTLREQIEGLRQSTPAYPRARRALEKIVRAIYANPKLRSAPPEAVGKAYEQACEALGG
jgi:hypothetical protein